MGAFPICFVRGLLGPDYESMKKWEKKINAISLSHVEPQIHSRVDYNGQEGEVIAVWKNRRIRVRLDSGEQIEVFPNMVKPLV